MKRTIFMAAMALCLLAGTSVFAQGTQPEKKDQPRMKMTVEQIAQKKTDKMAEALKLDEKQSKQVYDYTLEKMKQMQAKRAEMMQERKAEKEKMKAILTPEQFAQWEQMQGPKPGQGMGNGKHCKAACDKAANCDKPCKTACDKAANCDKPCKTACGKGSEPAGKSKR